MSYHISTTLVRIVSEGRFLQALDDSSPEWVEWCLGQGSTTDSFLFEVNADGQTRPSDGPYYNSEVPWTDEPVGQLVRELIAGLTDTPAGQSVSFIVGDREYWYSL